MSKFANTVKHELHEMIAPTVYFFVALHLVVLIRVLVNKDTGIDVASTASIGLPERRQADGGT